MHALPRTVHAEFNHSTDAGSGSFQAKSKRVWFLAASMVIGLVSGRAQAGDPERACCLGDGGCMNATVADCEAAGGTPSDDANDMCTAPRACCMPAGGCADLDPVCCELAGGTPDNLNTPCRTEESCCLPDGGCVDWPPRCCLAAGGIAGGVLSSCAPAEACCLGDGACTEGDPECCADAGGLPLGADSICETPQGCDFDDGSCEELEMMCCLEEGGIPQGEGTQCVVPEACCIRGGECVNLVPEECAAEGGVSRGVESACTEPESCCLGDGTCEDMDPLCCLEAGGQPQGPGSDCENTPCGGEGCGAGYWKLIEGGPSNAHHECNWAYNAPDDLFGETCASTDPTVCFEDAFAGWSLIDVLGPLHRRDGCEPQLCSLGFHTMAALLNAESPDVSYDLTAEQVIGRFNEVYPGTWQEYNELKAEFARLNGNCCPLGNCKDGGLADEPCGRKGSSARNSALSSGCGAVGMASLLGMIAGMTGIGRTIRRVPRGRKRVADGNRTRDPQDHNLVL